ncbi:MAG: adenylyltransferase/cytidyltransferase family protein [Candidatus Kaiserbacteria bacterium]|nr:adenylyltransferase/cytidyltransferase family protein [Candidatus Kaiserbacteria bacterium]
MKKEKELEKKYHEVHPDTTNQRALRIIKGTATFEDRFVPDHGDLIKLISALRSMGCIIVFVTGVWDLWHIGHGNYLQKGKDEGAKLYPNADHVIMVVGVDSDDFTRFRKGPNRPIVPEDERCQVLGHIRSVDVITMQYEADQLFLVVDHDVRIISESTKDLPNLEEMQRQCAHIVNLPPQAETSTTARIRRLSLDGAASVLLKIEEGLKATLQEVHNELAKK